MKAAVGGYFQACYCSAAETAVSQKQRALARGPQIGLGGLRPRMTRQGYPSVVMKRLNRCSFA